MSRTLYILVDDFSDHRKEAFFEKELPYHCQAFEKIYVVSLYPENNKTLNYTNSRLRILEFDYFSACNRPTVFFKNFLSIIRIILFELYYTHDRLFYFRNFRLVLNHLVLTFSAAANLETFIKKDINADTLFYSYWFKQWTAALSIIKTRQPGLKFVSRVHGGDYDEDQIKTVLPFRYFQLSKINKVFPVSEYGKNYLVQKFKAEPSKIVTSRLGLNIEPKIGIVNEDALIIVSCSSVIALKRVDLIVQILKYIKRPVKWIHFGDGDLLEDVKKKALELRHTVDFKGYVPNSCFTEYLKNNPVSVFINVSESEGIPVSMMEAIAHGIPLIGTSVCGVPEIVTPATGVLFPVDFEPENVANKIQEMHEKRIFYDADFRKGICSFYKDRFFVAKNHQRLAELLDQI